MKKFLIFFFVFSFFHFNIYAYARSEYDKFITLLIKDINYANNQVRQDRCKILHHLKVFVEKQKPISNTKTTRLKKIAKKYLLSDLNFTSANDYHKLLQHVNTVPVSLILAQAVESSNWGTSKIYSQTNNLFMLKCYSIGCGKIINNRIHDPSKTQRDQYYEIKKFSNLKQAIAAQILHINTAADYKHFRNARNNNAPLTKLFSSVPNSKKLKATLNHSHLDFYDGLYPCNKKCPGE